MEKLNRRSDGIYETISGFTAIIPKKASGGEGEKNWFEFKPTVFSDPVRVEWIDGAPFVLTEQSIAVFMIRNGYADNINDELMEMYNSVVEEHNTISDLNNNSDEGDGLTIDGETLPADGDVSIISENSEDTLSASEGKNASYPSENALNSESKFPADDSAEQTVNTAVGKKKGK